MDNLQIFIVKHSNNGCMMLYLMVIWEFHLQQIITYSVCMLLEKYHWKHFNPAVNYCYYLQDTLQKFKFVLFCSRNNWCTSVSCSKFYWRNRSWCKYPQTMIFQYL